MMKRTLLALGCGALAMCLLPASSEAVVIYDYNSSTTASGYTLNALPTDIADVGTLATLPAGQSYSVTSFSVARYNGATAGSFDVGFFFYLGVDTTSTTSVFSNLAYSTSFNRTASGTTSVTTTTVTLATPITMTSGQTFGYQMEYANAGTINLTTAAYTPTTTGSSGFFINQGTVAGSGTSPDTFYVDANNDGKLVASDLTNVGVAGYSNVYLVINATIVPEPGTNAALAVGGFAALGCWGMRRRSAAV